jgi:hypothetical protein
MEGHTRPRLAGGLDIFAADVRSLAALRIVLALTTLADLAMRAPNVRVHYSDDGIVPRQTLLHSGDPWSVSAAQMSGAPQFQAVLFAVATVAAAALLLGWRTRLMTLVVWAVMLSLQWRNPFIGYSADALLRLLLFWSLFVPLGAVWSLDRRRGAAPPSSMRVVSLGTAGLLVQIALMYWVTALLKTGHEWRVDGSALTYALSIQELATPLGTALLQFPELLRALTFLTLGIEIIAPPLLFSPLWNAPLRLAGIAAIVGLQTGIWLTLRLGIFPWLAAACMVVFLPSAFWEAVLPRWRRWVGPGLHAPDGPHPSPLPRARPAHGDGSGASGLPFWPSLAAGFCLVYVLAWNLASVSPVTLTADARVPGSLLGLAQSWTMFAPYPVNSTTWYTIPGTLRDGRRVELLPVLFSGAPRIIPASEGKPRDMSAAFAGDERWRKYFENLHDANNAYLLAPLADYLCREWNAAHGAAPDALESLQVIFHWERTLLDGRRAPVEQAVQWEQRCATH